MFCGFSEDSFVEGTSWSFKEKKKELKELKIQPKTSVFLLLRLLIPTTVPRGLAVVLQVGMGRQRRFLGQEGPD